MNILKRTQVNIKLSLIHMLCGSFIIILSFSAQGQSLEKWFEKVKNQKKEIGELSMVFINANQSYYLPHGENFLMVFLIFLMAGRFVRFDPSPFLPFYLLVIVERA